MSAMMPDPKMGCVGGATDLGALPESNHKFESVGGVLEPLNHGILKAFFDMKRQANATKKANALKENAQSTYNDEE